MTKDEAIYCLKSYLPYTKVEQCLRCKYYSANQIDENIHSCKSSEAHMIAIEALKRDDSETEFQKRLKDSTIYGYSFDELLTFARACRRANISNDDLKDFCTNIKCAYTHLMKEISEQVEHILLKGMKNEQGGARETMER